jgi:ATP:ADP antiporter, AAA family
MSRRPFLLKLLNVRPAEWKVVSQLFWLQFFMGTGVAFFFTASFTHFLEKFSASQLAWVMIISSPLLFITGWVFNKFEHRFHLTSVGTVVIILMAASIFILQISSNWIKDDWFDYFIFAWYYVLYLASNLCFWSITSTLFDVRQSKRLFAVISGGDIPAKFIGYTMAYFFVKAIGPLNMLWPAFIFMLGALPFLNKLSKSGVIHHHDHHPDHSIEFIQGKGFKAFVKRYTLNVLIRRIAVLTFIISSCLAIVNYAFYFEIKEVHHDDKSLSGFIILFMAASQIIALLVKIIFTGRIVTSIGIKKSLLITPIVLLALLIIIISAQYAVGYETLVFYTFGMAAVAVEVLRIAITNPVFLTVMQPLNPNARSKAHAIVKGIMDPFAFLFAGILLVLINMNVGNELLTICYILAFLAISWVASVFLVNNSYHNTLLKTISSRFFSQDEFKLSDEEIQHQILKKIKTGKETEIINILQMLNTQISNVSKEIIFKLLDHPSYNIKKVTLILIQTRNIKGAEEKLKHLADHDENKEIQYLAAQSLCKEQSEHHSQNKYLHHHDPKIKIAAITGMIKSPAKENREHAQTMIHDLIRSEKIKDKQMALQILSEVKEDYCHPDHADLFTTNRDLRIAAFKAIGPSATARLLGKVMTYFKEHSLHVASVLHAAGEKSIPIILENLSDKINPSFKEKLIIVIGKIGGTKAHETLLYLLEKYPTDSGAIAKALHRSRYKATQETQKKLEEISFAYINYGIELLSMQNLLDGYQEKYAVINSSLNIELAEIRNILICLFGCLYDHEKAFKIKQGLDMKKKESVANAMEVIEMTVKKELAMPFNLLYEPADIEHRYNSLKKFLPQDTILQAEDILSRILTEKPIFYNAWTKASTMYISKRTATLISAELIKKFTHSENLLLKETALYAQ